MPKFDLEQFLKTIQDYGITRAHLVPPIVLALAKHPIVDQFNLSSLKRITCGAAPLSEDTAQKAAQRLGCVVKQGYGMTEASPVTHINPDEPGKVRGGAAGVTIRNTETRIVDYETGKDLAVDEVGEVWVRGPQVMKGYLNQPEATARTVDTEGWLHTGDIGRMDADGNLFIVDRLKELIKYKGFQVAPAELEAVLLSNPAIADAAVIPSPDEEAGEVPVAYVVLKGEITPQAIMDYVAERVAPHKKLRRIVITQQIPKSASGKILRRILVQQENAEIAANAQRKA
jgi:acyl-CoA synthetase (AMP-forming)/AMP-acid ligase II